jgi:Pectate lyase superfamily protein
MSCGSAPSPVLQESGLRPQAISATSGWEIAGVGDFDNDRRTDDIVWRNVKTGDNAFWYMSGATLIASDFITQVTDLDWYVGGVADLDGDGVTDDLVWRNNRTLENSMWFMQGKQIARSVYFANGVIGAGWRIEGAGDFNGDRKGDLVWRNYQTGENSVWFMNEAVRTGATFLTSVGDLDWKINAVTDMDNDGKTDDLVWRNTRTFEQSMWFMDGGTISSASFFTPGVPDSAWRIEAAGDSNGDGKGDLFWRNYANGQNAIWTMNGTSLIAGTYFDESVSSTSTAPIPPPSTVGDRVPAVVETYPAGAMLQQGGRLINIKQPPAGCAAAVGDGIADDTAAIRCVYDYLRDQFQNAAGPTPIEKNPNLFIYMPNGTYRVRDSLFYNGPAITGDLQWYGLNRIRVLGESRENTIIRLDDSAPGFADATRPKPVLSFQHPDQRFNNWPGENVLKNVTVNVGRNNPGAVGVFFQGANVSELSNVRLVSGDGQGAIGLWLKIGSVQVHVTDLLVEGFDYGIRQTENGETSSGFEYVTLRNQRRAAISVTGGGVYLRRILSEQKGISSVPALRVEGSGAHVVAIDSRVEGNTGNAFELSSNANQTLFARGIAASGYSRTIVRNGVTVSTDSLVSEYVSHSVNTLFAGQNTRSLNLQIEDTPRLPWYNPLTEWAKPNGTNQVAVNQALLSGKPVVYFPGNSYSYGAIKVPASVKRLNFMFANASDVIEISEASNDPLEIIYTGGYPRLQLRAKRNIILRTWGGNFENLQTEPIKLFIENGVNLGYADTFSTSNQTTYARSINAEPVNVPASINCNGGRLWIFNFKTENKPSAALKASNGCQMEVLGGYANTTTPTEGSPMIISENSKVFFTGFTNLGGRFDTLVRETRGTDTRLTAKNQVSSRGGDYPDVSFSFAGY